MDIYGVIPVKKRWKKCRTIIGNRHSILLLAQKSVSYQIMASIVKYACRSGTALTIVLLVIIVVQWVLFTLLLNRSYVASTGTSSIMHKILGIGVSLSNDSRRWDKTTSGTDQALTTRLHGVAVTVMYRAPKWFHLRYKVMIDNAIANLPEPVTWKVQIFINEKFQNDQNLLEWNPGLVKMFNGHHPQVIVTPLPANLTGPKNKPKDVVFSSWFWEHVAAERVLLFSGNGAFCGNQLSDVWTKHALLDLDYLGVPSFDFDGVGGDGSSHSLRSRAAMLRITRYRRQNGLSSFGNTEDHETLKTMLLMNKKKSDEPYVPFKIASVEQTIAFGGVYDLSNDTIQGLVRLPLVVAGTQSRLTYAERDSLLKHCPELKVIFPSLHEPACFGAHPNPAACKASICALQENISSHGC